jgi:hypothetical protein
MHKVGVTLQMLGKSSATIKHGRIGCHIITAPDALPPAFVPATCSLFDALLMPPASDSLVSHLAIGMLYILVSSFQQATLKSWKGGTEVCIFHGSSHYLWAV